jgi:hypothetical protein|tara:strand:- start:2531 stop:2749 length:219 start_codon:yes stop_codon:yes gene_type:complete
MLIRKNLSRFTGAIIGCKDIHVRSLLKLIARRKDSIRTTSQAFVFTKYGIEIRSAIKLIITPARTLIWRIAK